MNDFLKKDNLLPILYFLGMLFIVVLVAGYFVQSELNPFYMAISVTAFFGGFL